MAASHTILLIQPTTRLDSRTYSDYESLTEALEAICKIFEDFIGKKLKESKPNSTDGVTYDISQIFEFLDKLADLSVMVFNRETAQYVPRNRAWIKQHIFEMMRSRCKHPESGENIIVGY